MAVFGQIPLPQQKNMFEGIMEQWLKQKELAETSKYHQSEVEIRKMAEQRAQQLMPYLKQHYKDLHGATADTNALNHLKRLVAQNEYDSAIAALKGNGAPQAAPKMQVAPKMEATAGMGQEPSSFPAPYSNESPADADEAETQRMREMGTAQHARDQRKYEQAGQQSGQQSGQGNGSLGDVMQPLMNSSFGVNKPPMMGMPAQANNQMENPGLNAQQPPEMAQPTAQGAIPPTMPKESIIQPGKPGMELQDQLAGSSIGTPLKRHYGKDGWVYTEYPSGKITANQNPMEAGKSPAVRKEMESINGTIDKLIPHMKTVAELQDILDRKPDLTGKATQVGKFFGMTSDPDVGRFSSGSLSLQTDMAKDLSSRGGYGVAKIVAANKPDIGNSVDFNKGALSDLKRKSIDSFFEMKKKYEKVNPDEEFPYKLEDIFPTITVRNSKGKEIKLPTQGALQLLQDHPDHKIVG